MEIRPNIGCYFETVNVFCFVFVVVFSFVLFLFFADLFVLGVYVCGEIFVPKLIYESSIKESWVPYAFLICCRRDIITL